MRRVVDVAVFIIWKTLGERVGMLEWVCVELVSLSEAVNGVTC